MATNYPGLANHLRKWGLNVREESGWQTRSATGSFTPLAVMVHHTATAGPANAPSLGIVRDGRTGIPGPLSQFLLARDGTVHVISGNRANHAGYGGPIAGIPKDAGNRYAWGIEAENDGRGEKWNTQQLNAYYRLCAALLALMGKTPSSVVAHKEWAPSRKIDPAGIDMNGFRANVAAALKAGPSGGTDPILKQGSAGSKVSELQTLLNKHKITTAVDDDFGPATAKSVNTFKARHGLPVDGVAGPKVWEGLRKPYVAPGAAPAPAPAPAPTPAPLPDYVFSTGRDGLLIQFRGDSHVWEIIGSELFHVTAASWRARRLNSTLVKIVEPDHPLSQLPKNTY